MRPDKKTESEEILEYRYAREDSDEGDFSYSETIMDESLAELLSLGRRERH